MGCIGGSEHFQDAMARLDALAQSGSPPQEVAFEAELIVAGWWWDGQGALAPDRLVLLVQELRHWCAIEAESYARRWDRLHRAGRPKQAEEARRWALALDQAQRALHLYD